jgi:hypothetical protein
MKRNWYFIAPLAILAMALFAFIGGEVVLHLWNWLLPSLFGWRPITFWQAIGILVLCRILFGHHGWRGPGRSNFRRRIAERMSERCRNMSPEERERFRQAMRERWEFRPSTTETKEQ